MGTSSEPSPRRRLALAQCAPRLGDVAANLELHRELAEQALDEGANLCIFPELSLTGYLLKDLVPEVSMTLDDPHHDGGLGSAESWGDLCRTVAQFSGSYVAYCNRTGYEDGVYFWGGSTVIGPDGGTVAAGEGTSIHDEGALPQGNQLVVADIDIREVERQRQVTPLLRDEKIDFT